MKESLGVFHMEKQVATSGRSEPFAAVLYSEPSSLGLVCNIIAAFIVAVENIQGEQNVTELAAIVTGLHLILIGGFLQITAGILGFRKNDHLIGTAFIVFATLWTFQGGMLIITKVYGNDVTKSALPVLVAYVTIALSLFICSLFVNFIIPPVLVAMTLALTFESVGLFYAWGKKTAAAFELIIVVTAIYALIVSTTKGISQRYILPGFGNAPIDPLLIKRNVAKSSKREKRKNTKYAEPMGLGYLGNIIPASVVCFVGIGFWGDMAIPALAVSCGAVLHIMASYYSFLRGDLFNSVQFIAHSIFWTSKPLIYFFVTDSDLSAKATFYGSWGIVLVLLFITVCSSTQTMAVFIYNGVLTLTSILSVEHIPESTHNYTFGVSAIFVWVFTIYISTAHLLNSCAEKPVLPLGSELVSEDRLFCCCKKKSLSRNSASKTDEELDDENRDQIINVVNFLCNMVSAFALSPFEVSNQLVSLSFLLTAGILGNLLVARYSYARGSLSQAFVGLSHSFMWTAWSLYFFNVADSATYGAMAVTSLGFCTLSLLVTVIMPKTWILQEVSILLLSISFTTHVFVADDTKYFPLVSSILLGLVCAYGFILYLGKGTSDTNLLPEGAPLIKTKKPSKTELPCLTFRSRIASDLMRAAKVLEKGEVICVPTDTVYALAGSCSKPESISKIYHIKGRPPEKPICLCISNLQQLKVANPPFSALLWKFMDRCYPGGITCVVKKGAWLQNLGVGESVDFVGTKDSVAIRVPDSSVLSYLVSITGPLAITSANPSGEPDSTHHNTVLNTLGEKLAGVVCDDESNESVASTVVNCMKIDEEPLGKFQPNSAQASLGEGNSGVISYFRIGCVPQEIVDQLFDDVKKEFSE